MLPQLERNTSIHNNQTEGPFQKTVPTLSNDDLPPPTQTNPSKDEEANDSKQTEFDILQVLSKYNIIGGFWVFTWFSLNMTIAFGNKIVYWQGFNFPTLLSLFHMLTSWMLAFLSLRCQKQDNDSSDSTQDIRKEAKKSMWLYIIIFILNIVYGNIGMFRTSLHMSQIVRGTTPLFVMVLSYLIVGTTTSFQKLGIVLLVVAGVIMALVHNLEINMSDILILMIGNVFAALKTVLTNLSLKSHKIAPLVLMNFIAPYASLGMFLITIVNGELFRFTKEYHNVNMYGVLAVVLTSVMSFLLNTTNFMANKMTSPLTMSLTANLKQVLVVVVSLCFIHQGGLTSLNVIGISVTLSGMLIYSLLSL